MRKYKLGEKHPNRNLYRVIYLRDIPRHHVSAGEEGGWVEHEGNLSQKADCVVLGEAKIYENAKVYGNACILTEAEIFGNAKVYDEASVSLYAKVFDNAKIYGKTDITHNARIGGNMKLKDGKSYSEAPTLLSKIIKNSRLTTK